MTGTLKSEPVDIELLPGCQPGGDRTALSTQHAIFTDKIRWFQGFPQKVGGWQAVNFDYGATIQGVCRRIFSAFLSQQANLVTALGTNSNLYALSGTALTNITPLNLNYTTVANSLASDYRLLAANPLATANGSNVVTITDANASQYEAGDVLTLSGCAAVNGITAAMLNQEQIVRSVGAGSYTIKVNGTATGNGSGGGSGCNIASGLVTMTAAAHGQANGQNVGILNAANFAGLTAAQINMQFEVRDAATNTFQFMTTGFATSAVTAGGGALTAYQTQIAPGSVDENVAQGYGAGPYGVGLYGTALLSVEGRNFPRIWYIDRFEQTMIMTPGNQGGLYDWNGGTETAPVPLGENVTGILATGNKTITSVSDTTFVAVGNPITGNGIPSGATVTAVNIDAQTITISAFPTVNGTENLLLVTSPQDINYAFVSNDIVVTFGHQNVGNQIFASDQINAQNWNASLENQVFQDTVSGAGPLISHLSVSGTNIIFSQTECYLFSYIGLPEVWDIQLLSDLVGIIAPLAGIVVNGVAYWMGLKNWYRWRGMGIEIIPANSQQVSTILNYVYNNLTSGQRSKIFTSYNEQFGEICWHYPDATSMEPNCVARLNVNENFIWVPDTLARTAAEAPDVLGVNPRLIDSNGVLYNHETGTDANGAALPFTLISNLRTSGKNSKYISSVIPDSNQVGNLTVTLTGYQYPQSVVPLGQQVMTITPTTEFEPVSVGARYWQYEWAGDQLGQSWAMGRWQEFIQEGSPK